MFTETEHLIKEMIENIGKIRQNRDTNFSVVKEQKRIIETEIQELVCRSDALFFMLTIFVWYSVSSFSFSSKDTSSSRVSSVTCFTASVSSFIRSSCNVKNMSVRVVEFVS
jgi:hypothetical protein